MANSKALTFILELVLHECSFKQACFIISTSSYKSHLESYAYSSKVQFSKAICFKMPELTVTSEIYGEYDYRTKTTPSTDGSKYEIIWNYLFTYLFYEFLISIRATAQRWQWPAVQWWAIPVAKFTEHFKLYLHYIKYMYHLRGLKRLRFDQSSECWQPAYRPTACRNSCCHLGVHWALQAI